HKPVGHDPCGRGRHGHSRLSGRYDCYWGRRSHRGGSPGELSAEPLEADRLDYDGTERLDRPDTSRVGAGVRPLCRMPDTARLDRAIELLTEAQVRLAGGSREAYILIDIAIRKLHDELAERMLEDAAEEIAGL